MAIEVVLPMLGITIEKGKILKWLKAEGDFVKKGEIIFEVETEKVVTEVESPGTGVLRKILVPENQEVPVLTLVAVITDEKEELPGKYRIASTADGVPSPSAGPKAKPAEVSQSAGDLADDRYQIAVLGGGPGGYVAAIRGAQMGARVILIERGELGGTCLNRGCIPTKSFLADVKALRKIQRSEVFSKSAELGIDWPKAVARKNRIVETLREGVHSLLKSNKVTILRGQARFLDAYTVEVAADGKMKNIRAQNIIIATGSRPAMVSSIQADGQAILTSDDIVNLQGVPKEIIIIGGGVIGVEFAAIFNGLGAKVTVLEMLPEILATEEPEVISGLKAILKKEGIEIINQARVLRALSQKGQVEVTVDREGKEEKYYAEKVLVAVGRTPNVEALDLSALHLQMEGRFIKVNRRMETNAPGVYAIGDVIGGMMLAHAASAEGIIAVENIMGKKREIDYDRIPSCVYTFPEVASVGLKEKEAKRRGYEVQIGKFPFRNSGKALAMGETEGFVKIIAEKTLGQILGVHILGEHATDLIGECLLGMNLEASIEDLGDVVKGHPTLSEAVMEAALDVNKVAIHLPAK